MVGIISQSPINMPTADMPLTMGEDGKPTQIWWRFWFSLLRRTLQTIPNTTNNAVVATGTTQADAVPLDSEWNVVTTTPPGTGGAPATYYNRYQVALQSLPGALFTIGDETVNFESGDVWLIDNKKEHGVINNSRDDRIVMIVDIRS